MQGKDHSFGKTVIRKRERIKNSLGGEECVSRRMRRMLKQAIVMYEMVSGDYRDNE